MHYYRWRRHGDPSIQGRLALPRTADCGDFAEMFWLRADRRGDTECWNWKQRLLPNGYGRINDSRNGTRPYAHRVSYELSRGSIPNGFEVHHLCGNKACVNPAHLEALSVADHRGLGWGRTHCPHGHEYTAENTYVNPKGVKVCRACNARSKRKPRR